MLKVIISKNEKVDFEDAKRIINKGRRMIKQNKLNAIVVEIDSSSRVDKSAVDLFEKVLCYSDDFPVIMIGA